MRLLCQWCSSLLIGWWGYMVDHEIDADGGLCNVCRTAVVRINHEWRHALTNSSSRAIEQREVVSPKEMSEWFDNAQGDRYIGLEMRVMVAE